MRRFGVVAFVAALVAACGQGAASAGPSAPLASTAGPTTAGSAGPSAPATTAAPPASAGPTPSLGPGTFSVLPPGSAIEVAIAELNLREAASTSAARVEILKRGQVLIVAPYDGLWFGVGPVKQNGYTWYPVLKLQSGTADDLPALPTRPILIGTEVVSGWVATDDGNATYVTALAPRCPTTVDLVNVEGMLSAERLACFGGAPIVLEGTYGCDGCGGAFPGSFEPPWLASPESYDFLSVNPPEQFGPVALRFAPGGPERPSLGQIIRVRVHVDDPASAGCKMSGLGTNGELVPIPDATAVLLCREQLVVESYEVTGTDPDFAT